MYQALYRKWRPKTFDDVVGQSHITDTLKQQIASGRPSHAYLFTGTRGTGKTSCAKILSRAVNCENPRQGNPCNACPACLGIENGSILDVLELDAASNNGVDQVRALRDEAVYTPAAVRKRVYIVDEVHMLSTPAFNALLKILEEPPAHLVFILATTELHKVPATIKSRCQQFSFKRILPGQISQRLAYVAGEEGIELTKDAAEVLARLADGGLRDALSLLDQCAGGRRRVDEQDILDTLGLAGNLETANLMSQVAQRDTAAALENLSRLYGAGKDIGSVLGEMSGLARDLLLRKTAPRGAAALMTGGFDETTMRNLGEQFTAQRLLQMLTILQNVLADLPRSSNRRTDAELCLIRLCDQGLDESLSGLAVRVAQLEERLANGVPAAQIVSSAPAGQPALPAQDLPPWEEERPPLPEEPPEFMEPVFDEPEPPVRQMEQTPRPAPAPRRPKPSPAPEPVSVSVSDGEENRAFWPAFAAGLKGKISPAVTPYLNNPQKVTGVWKNGKLTLWTDNELTRSLINKPAILDGIAKAASASFGCSAVVSVVTGQPPAAPAPKMPAAEDTSAALNELLNFAQGRDNITIK